MTHETRSRGFWRSGASARDEYELRGKIAIVGLAGEAAVALDLAKARYIEERQELAVTPALEVAMALVEQDRVGALCRRPPQDAQHSTGA